MMILADFYSALAILLIASAGLLLVWQLGSPPASKQLLVIAAILFVLGGLAGAGSLVYYGGHLMHKGECPYAEPLVPCPTGPSSQPAPHHPSQSLESDDQDESSPKLQYRRMKSDGIVA